VRGRNDVEERHEQDEADDGSYYVSRESAG
jgi:hypothetical protein